MDFQDTPAFMSSSSPIMKLNHDILWKIFMFNSHPITYPLESNANKLLWIGQDIDISPKPAMITTRRSSQVCSKWREVLLGQHRSSVWANTLDMQYLDQKEDDWREEVLRRTGDAPLTVVGNVGKGGLYNVAVAGRFAQDFLFKLLDVHWERIRLLVICSTGSEVNEKLRVALNRPAPWLQYCIVRFYSREKNDHNPVTPFENDAPRLSSFGIDGAKINISSISWAKKLRYLNLVASQITIPMSEFLRKLEQAPALEILCIYFRTSEYDLAAEGLVDMDLPPISLPKLKHLALPYAHPDVLSHISVSPRCTIAMECSILNQEQSDLFSAFVQMRFPTWNITHLSYVVKPSYEVDSYDHRFHHIVMKDDDATSTVPHFDFSGYSWATLIVLDMACALSSSACQPSLHGITSTTLKLDANALLNYTSLDDMTTLLHNLRSVKTFHTDDKTLMLVHAETSPEPNLTLDGCSSWFPDLCTIVVDKWDLGIETFLRLRLENDADMLGGERPQILVLLEDAKYTNVGDPGVVKKASMFGVSVGWKVHGSEVIYELPPNSIMTT